MPHRLILHAPAEIPLLSDHRTRPVRPLLEIIAGHGAEDAVGKRKRRQAHVLGVDFQIADFAVRKAFLCDGGESVQPEQQIELMDVIQDDPATR